MAFSTLLVCLLVGYVAAQTQETGAWKANYEYRYHVESRALASLNDIADEYSGSQWKADLVIRPRNANILNARVENAQQADIHSKLPQGWESRIPDSQLSYRPLELSNKPFEIHLKNGVVKQIFVEKDTPKWQINILKSLVSQLQVDLQGENLIASRYTQKPEENENNAVFKTMEDTLTAKCETLYTVYPMLESHLQEEYPELSHMQNKMKQNENNQFIKVVKSKNYSNCEQYVQYSHGLEGLLEWNSNNEIFSQSYVSNIVVTGNMKRHTIQSVVTKNEMIVNPVLYENLKGLVATKVNMTLSSIEQNTNEPEQMYAPVSAGNLLFGQNAENNENRRHDESLNSSEENQFHHIRSPRNRRAINEKWGNQVEDSSSSIQSASDETEWQQDQDLNEPARNNFGVTSKRVDKVVVAQKLIKQIAEVVENTPSMIHQDNSLAKFKILTKLVSMMNTNELNKLTQQFQANNEQQTAWKVLRDAVAECGSGPALKIIHQWIQNKNVHGVEAAQIVSTLARTAVETSNQYMNELWNIVNSEEVKAQQPLENAAILAYTSLTRQILFDRENSKSHFLHRMGQEQVDRQVQTTFEKVLPHLEQQLKRAIEEDNSQTAQVTIRAIGNIAHPRILAIFKPYLENNRKTTPFQRVFMVAVLDHLAETYPEETRSVSFKIYSNNAEHRQLRTVAVFILMKTNPPADMLKRMAQQTHTEQSQEVRSAVKTAIQHAARLTTPKHQKLAKDARQAEKLLDSTKESIEQAQDIINSFFDQEMDLGFKQCLQYSSNVDSRVPNFLKYSLRGYYGQYSQEQFRVSAMVSSTLDLMKSINDQFEDKQENKNQIKSELVKKIEELLNLKFSDDNSQQDSLQGNVFAKILGVESFFAFDNHSIQKLPREIASLMKNINTPKEFNLTKFFHRDQVVIRVPLENGLVFTFEMYTPTLVSLSGKIQMNNDVQMTENNQIRMPEIINANADINLLVSTQISSKFGFIMQNEQVAHLAGYEQNLQVNVPANIKVELNTKTNKARLEMTPLYTENDNEIAHYSTYPYTGKINMIDFKPERNQENVKIVHKYPLKKYNHVWGQENQGMALRFIHQYERRDHLNLKKTFEQILNNDWSQLVGDEMLYSYHSLRYVGESNRKLVLNIQTKSHKSLQNSEEQQEEQEPRQNEWFKNMQENKDKSETRQEYLLKQVKRGVKNSLSYVFDVATSVQGGKKSELKYVASIAFARNATQEKTRVLFYGAQIKNDEQPMQIYVAAQIKQNQPHAFNFAEALKSKPEMKSEIELTFGQDYQTGARIQVEGKHYQTEERRQHVEKTDLAKQCAHQMEEENYILPACVNATYQAQLMDRIHLVAKYNQQAEQKLANAYENVNEIVKHLGFEYLNNQHKHTEQDNNEIVVDVIFKPSNFGHVNVSIETNDQRNVYELVPVARWMRQMLASHPRYSVMERLAQTSYNRYHTKSIAVLDGTSTTTFNNRTHKLFLGECQHVFAHINLENLPKYQQKGLQSITVLAKDVSQNKRQITIIVAHKNGQETVIEIVPNPESDNTANKPRTMVKVNQKPIMLGEEKFNPIKSAHDTIIGSIYSLINGNVRVHIKDLVELECDGTRVKMGTSENTHDQIRGIAGTFSLERSEDNVAPTNCLLRDSRDFVASYAIADETCQGPAKDLNKHARQAVCTQRNYKSGNYVSERDVLLNKNSLRQKENMIKHQTRYVVEKSDDSICFTIRPMPRCQKNSVAVEEQTKRVEVHCLPRSGPVTLWMKQIDNGASPDFSNKSVTKTIEIRISKVCH